MEFVVEQGPSQELRRTPKLARPVDRGRVCDLKPAIRTSDRPEDGGSWPFGCSQITRLSDPRETGPRLFDGSHQPQNVACTGYVLGLLSGACLVMACTHSTYASLYVFLFFLFSFHMLEYIATALYMPLQCEFESFLIPHSPAYIIAQASAVLEYLLTALLFPGLKRASAIRYGVGMVGFLCAFGGQSIRFLGMRTLKSNFNHEVQLVKRLDHELVTTGILSVLRHPAYTGFYYWALGTQLLLGNPICFVCFLTYLHGFFDSRIREEEEALSKFFEGYKAYRARTRTFIPFAG